jgi:hypothetical protein
MEFYFDRRGSERATGRKSELCAPNLVKLDGSEELRQIDVVRRPKLAKIKSWKGT